MIKFVISLVGLMIGGVLLLSSMKVPSPTKRNTVSVEGTIEKIYEGGVRDVVFKLEDDDRLFYINRGLENGLDLSELKDKYIGKKLTLTYINHKYLFDIFVSNSHLAEVKTNDTTIYSEFKDTL